MPFENSSGIGVSNYYGRRDTGSSVGVEHSQTSNQRLSFEITDQTLQGSQLNLGPKFKMLQGAHVTGVFLRVDEAFTMTGTTPGLVFGGAAPATNGIAITSAELAAVGTKIPASTGTGTWSVTSATGTIATENVTVALTGTTPAVTPGAGRATLIVNYVYKNRPKPAV